MKKIRSKKELVKLSLKVPGPDRKVTSLIKKEVEKARTATISFHARPDGDAVGGGLALKRLLEQKGLSVNIISPGSPPEVYRYLEGFESIKTEPGITKTDLCFILDCSDSRRLESLGSIIKDSSKIINIDHHQFNSMDADINYVRPDSSSVCELILNLFLRMKVDVDLPAAICIYTGILTDTNRFQEKNATARSLRIAADFIECGLDPVVLFSKIYGNLPVNRLKLISECIRSLKITSEGKIAYITVTPEMLEKTGTSDENLEGIINYARNLRGVEVGILFRKIPGLNGVKASFRSKGKADVGSIASSFGGGGHHNAGGCLVEGSFEEVIEKIISEVEKWTG